MINFCSCHSAEQSLNTHKIVTSSSTVYLWIRHWKIIAVWQLAQLGLRSTKEYQLSKHGPISTYINSKLFILFHRVKQYLPPMKVHDKPLNFPIKDPREVRYSQRPESQFFQLPLHLSDKTNRHTWFFASLFWWYAVAGQIAIKQLVSNTKQRLKKNGMEIWCNSLVDHTFNMKIIRLFSTWVLCIQYVCFPRSSSSQVQVYYPLQIPKITFLPPKPKKTLK